MASQEIPFDRETLLKILSAMVFSKPVALVTISQKTGVRLAEIIRYSTQLEKDRIIRRTVDNGTIFYVLIADNYHQILDSKYPAITAVSNQSLSAVAATQRSSSQINPTSREMIVKRRAAAKAAASAANNPVTDLSAPPIKKRSESISAVDLLAIKRSSAGNPRVYDPGRSSKFSSVKSSSTYKSITRSSSSLPSLSSLSQSDYHKAVFNSCSFTRLPKSNRSSFTQLPPAGFGSDFERSDGNIKQRTNLTPKSQGPIIPFKTTGQTQSKLSDADVRKQINITYKIDTAFDMPIVAILAPRPTNELWTAFSALANIGGGFILLGMKKYVNDDIISYFMKSISSPEDIIRTLLQKFNDRAIISDCPKDPGFIKILEFGRKRVIAIQVDPSQLANAPVYTRLDSFKGCYTMNNNEIVLCSEDEIKNIWIVKRLGNEIPDWSQSGELVPVQMNAHNKIKLPPVIDYSIMPLSRKECTFGQEITPPKLTSRRTQKNRENSPAEPYPSSQAASAAPLKTSRIDENTQQSSKYSQLVVTACSSAQKTLPENDELNVFIKDGIQEHVSKRSGFKADASTSNMLETLLFAEDICISPNQHEADFSQLQGSAPVVPDAPAIETTVTQNAAPEPAAIEEKTPALPPLLEDADRALLNEIAKPAVMHPRLPIIRVCEIAASLCRNARLRPIEIAEILNRKFVPICDKVMPVLKERNDIHCVDGYYYIQ